MRRFLLSLSSAALLLSPALSFAAFSTPSQLFQALQDDARARSFFATAHAGSQRTYVSVWANGKEQGKQAENTSLSMNVTVDVVQGTTKTRMKGQVLVIDEILYFKILSVQSTPKDAAPAVLQKQWISIPLVQSAFSSVSSGLAAGFFASEPTPVDSIFTLSSYTDKGLRVYKLSLTPDSAVDLAVQLRSLLNDTQSLSSDFFPWRELGKSLSFSMTVVLTGKDRFVSSSFSLSMKNKSSSFSAKGSEQILSGPLSLTTPSDVMSLSSQPQSASGLLQELPLELQEPSLPQEPPESGADLSAPNPVPSDSACTDPTVSPAKLLELQRSGVCGAKKVSTRYGGW